eukprot:g3942.t1
MVWSGQIHFESIRKKQQEATAKRREVLHKMEQREAEQRRLRAEATRAAKEAEMRKEEEEAATKIAAAKEEGAQRAREDTLRRMKLEKIAMRAAEKGTEDTNPPSKWISEGWNSRASYVRQSKLAAVTKCDLVVSLDFPGSEYIQSSSTRDDDDDVRECVRNAMKDARCGPTPARVATGSNRPKGGGEMHVILSSLPSWTCACCVPKRPVDIVGNAAPLTSVSSRVRGWNVYSVCVDNHELCDAWARNSKCESPTHKSFMRRHCSHSCGSCGSRFETSEIADDVTLLQKDEFHIDVVKEESADALWSSWSPCSVPCGEGGKRRRRCISGKCEGMSETACDARPCEPSPAVPDRSVLMWILVVPITMLSIMYGWLLYRGLTVMDILGSYLRTNSMPKESDAIDHTKVHLLLMSAFDVTEVEPDGNCLFVAMAAHWDGGDHVALRKRVQSYLSKNRRSKIDAMKLIQWLRTAEGLGDLPPGFVLTGNDLDDTERYLEFIGRDRSWGGRIEINAADAIIGKNIVVLEKAEQDGFYRERFRTHKTSARGEEVFIYYNGNNHYSRIRLRGEFTDASLPYYNSENEAPSLGEKRNANDRSRPRRASSSSPSHFSKGSACVYEKDGMSFAASIGSRNRDEFILDTPYRTSLRDVSLVTSTTLAHVRQHPYRSLFAQILDAQNGKMEWKGRRRDSTTYDDALREIVKRNKKLTHWIWYIWPTLKTLRPKTQCPQFLLPDFESAKMYLCNATLRSRLLEITEKTVEVARKNGIHRVLGAIDADKFHESTTLFLVAALMSAEKTPWRKRLVSVLRAAVQVAGRGTALHQIAIKEVSSAMIRGGRCASSSSWIEPIALSRMRTVDELTKNFRGHSCSKAQISERLTPSSQRRSRHSSRREGARATHSHLRLRRNLGDSTFKRHAKYPSSDSFRWEGGSVSVPPGDPPLVEAEASSLLGGDSQWSKSTTRDVPTLFDNERRDPPSSFVDPLPVEAEASSLLGGDSQWSESTTRDAPTLFDNERRDPSSSLPSTKREGRVKNSRSFLLPMDSIEYR